MRVARVVEARVPCSARWPFARHRLHVTGCTSRQRTRLPRWPSPAGRLLVSGPAGRHRWPVARHRLHVTSADPLPRWPSPVAMSPVLSALVSGPVARQRTRWPVARHVSGPAGRLLVTSADPLKMALFAYSGEFPEFYLLSLNINVYFNCSGETTSN